MRTWIVVFAALVAGLAIGYASTIAEFGISPPPPTIAKSSGRKAPVAAGKASPSSRPIPPPVDSPQPKVAIRDTVHRFGVMEHFKTGKHTFVIRNEGSGPLELKAGRPSCKCTVSRLSRNLVPPGESAEITLKWQTGRRMGTYSKTAPIYTNDRKTPEVRLQIVGEIRAAYAFKPQLAIFQNVVPSEPRETQLRLYHYKRADMEILHHTLSDPNTAKHFNIAYEPIPADGLEDSGAKCGYLITVGLKKGLPIGTHVQKVSFATNLKEKKPVEFRVSVFVRPEVDVIVTGFRSGWDSRRRSFDFGKIEPGTRARHELTLAAIGEHRNDVKYTVKEVVPKQLQVTFGEPKEVSGGLVIWTPLVLELSKDSGPLDYDGSEPGKVGHIVIETTHPVRKEVKLEVKLVVKLVVKVTVPK